ncbi:MULTISPECIES: HlyD family type I secretion periplasmic adaptor subunit [Rhodomicrobium]|uniref:HlyD family type I secretion periplasmic adaptor subunit n=1 Tax=Rhodomicrobium TaxID=1068 RepID=UPI000B4C18BF|nr:MULTISPECIES: HlyD family type I secretion periplasmic adaptor subunit [Rhodomicrobium]
MSPAILAAPASASRRNASSAAIRRHVQLGCLLLALLVIGIGGWAATATLAGAVIAPAAVIVETDVKKVQHQIGGIVSKLNVRDGDHVEAGAVLIRLDDTLTGANLAMVTNTLDELAGRRARLLAEQDGAAAVTFPEDLTSRAGAGNVARLIAGELKLFEARRAARAGQEGQLRERIAQFFEEVKGLEAQRNAKAQEIAFIHDELRGVESLYARNLLPMSRVTSMRRDATRLEGEKGQIISSIAQAKGKIAETELKIIQIDQDLHTEVLRDLRDIDARFGELMERRISAEDTYRRAEIRAPQSGIVHQLAVQTVGGVIGPGETLMLIVPQAEGLSIEARVPPQSIDLVRLGQDVQIRFSAFDHNATPRLNGSVRVIAADVTRDSRTGQTYYAIRIAISDAEIARLKGLQLVPGMPAEAHLQTHMRTVLSYLSKPLTDQFARAFRED